MKSSILSESPQAALKNYLHNCSSMGMDVQLIKSVITSSLIHLQGSKQKRAQTVQYRSLENRWYKSLSEGSPDWSVYDHDAYMAELWACWVVYSRRYLLGIIAPGSLNGEQSISDDMGNVKTVVDLGCGMGYTTASLAQLFNGATVYATNLPDTKQSNMAKRIGQQVGFSVVPTVRDILHSGVDLVFASEYFEHISAPVDDLIETVYTLSPRCLLIANTFTSKSIGHFDNYEISGARYDGRTTSRMFNDTLRSMGYQKIKTKMWNSRPAYWVRA